MKQKKHIQQLIGQVWCLSPVHFEAFIGDLERQQKDLSEQTFIEKLMAMWSWRDEETKPEPEGYELLEFEGKTFAMIRIEGVLVKKADYWDRKYGGMFGTAELLPIIDEIEADASIGGLLLVFDSPGGSVAGIEVLADRLYAFKKTSVALVDEMCCSGAYWLAAQTNKIISVGKTAEIGSIGVVAKHRDYSERNKEEGLKITYLTADGSPDKALGNSDEPLTSQTKKALIDLLNPVYETFVAQVRKSRRAVDSQAFTGKIFLAEQALELGLIDQIGLESDALKFLSKKSENITQPIFNTRMENTTPPVVAQANAQAAQVVPPANDQNLVEQMLKQMSAQMTNIQGELGALKTDLQAAKTENAVLRTNLAQAEQKAQTAETQAQKAEAQKAEVEKKLEETPEAKAEIPNTSSSAVDGTFSKRLQPMKPPKDDFEAIENIIAMGVSAEGLDFAAYAQKFSELPWNREKTIDFRP